jgi:tetratricopeptide (TPR) repeat protein
LYKLFWPVNLSFVYPRWTIDGGALLSFVPDVLLLAVVTVAWWQRRSWGRGLFMVLVCYVALLLPVLGFANIYFMRYSLVADHWQYAAMIVPVAGVAALVAGWARRRSSRIVVAAGALLLLGTLGALTYRQAGVYKDVETLWADVLRQNPESWLAHHSLGNWLANRGRLQEAVEHYKAVVRLKPDDFQAYNNLGVMLNRLCRPGEARVNFERALAINGNYGLARQNLNAMSTTPGDATCGRRN